MPELQVVSDFQPTGDQPQAIELLTKGINSGMRDQVLLGVTGSGKTYTMAKVIERVQKPTLILAHNKTLAAQLYSEMREFFPSNAVEYFVILLRLLPARGLHPPLGHLHREGLADQRGDRSSAPGGNIVAAQPARCGHCGLRFMHLRPGQPAGLRSRGAQPARRRHDSPQ